MCPLRGGEQHNLVVTFHSRHQEHSSVIEGSAEEVLSYFTGILERPRQLLSLPKSWKRWATADREPIAQWSFGRTTLLSDAAHPMLQYLAQGACLAARSLAPPVIFRGIFRFLFVAPRFLMSAFHRIAYRQFLKGPLVAIALIGSSLAIRAAHAADLTVSAAASLTNAFKEIGAVFEARNPGVKVQLNFGASGALLQQIAKGAPVDVFASADQETMDQAQQQGLVDAGARVNFVRNVLVVIVPGDSKQTMTSLPDLRGDGFRKIAIGQPASVPVGRYTKAVLEQAGLWSAIEPKMIAAQSVRQALDYVGRGEVDAGFVYATDAAIMPGKVRVSFTVPTTTTILYPIAPSKLASDPALAQRFVQFVSAAAAQAVLARYGFGRP